MQSNLAGNLILKNFKRLANLEVKMGLSWGQGIRLRQSDSYQRETYEELDIFQTQKAWKETLDDALEPCWYLGLSQPNHFAVKRYRQNVYML